MDPEKSRAKKSPDIARAYKKQENRSPLWRAYASVRVYSRRPLRMVCSVLPRLVRTSMA